VTGDKYAPAAEGWSEEQYADSQAYLAHRAELLVSLGPELAAGDTVLDLACGDGGLADFLPGVQYLGVDADPRMVAEAASKGRTVVHADLNDFTADRPAAATTLFRALYYARDRRAFFGHVAGYTTRKLVFDLNPRQYRPEDVLADLRASGWPNHVLRPFFVPQTRALPGPVGAALVLAERSGPPARLALRFRFTYLVAAWR
jgi:SAM-dependent methyltransferase